MRIFRVDEQAGNVYARVVDEDVNLAERVDSGFNHCLNAVGLRDVGDDVFDFAACFGEIE